MLNLQFGEEGQMVGGKAAVGGTANLDVGYSEMYGMKNVIQMQKWSERGIGGRQL